MNYRVGTIGFSYADWKPAFYPPATRSGDFLAAYAQVFDTLELDTTFHAIPPADRVAKWAAATPPGFTFCPKTPKQITHENPLAFAAPVMRQFLRALAPMHTAGKLGPILIQFPPALTVADFDNVARFLKDLPPDHRYAVEFRNHTWQTDSTAGLLADHRCALVAADYAGQDGSGPAPPTPFPIRLTTDFLYLRFIGVHQQFSPLDHERVDMTPRLTWWLEHIRLAIAEAPFTGSPGPTEIFALFNNDFAGHAPATANRFRQLVGQAPRTLAAPPPAQQSLF